MGISGVHWVRGDLNPIKRNPGVGRFRTVSDVAPAKARLCKRYLKGTDKCQSRVLEFLDQDGFPIVPMRDVLSVCLRI